MASKPDDIGKILDKQPSRESLQSKRSLTPEQLHHDDNLHKKELPKSSILTGVEGASIVAETVLGGKDYRQMYEEMQQKFKALEVKNKSEKISHEMEKEFFRRSPKKLFQCQAI